jgi:hypothetical protein
LRSPSARSLIFIGQSTPATPILASSVYLVCGPFTVLTVIAALLNFDRVGLRTRIPPGSAGEIVPSTILRQRNGHARRISGVPMRSTMSVSGVPSRQ